MVGVEKVYEWRGEDVFDTDGEKVGRLHEVFYDSATGEAVVGTVKAGFLGRRTYLVPLADASAGRGYLRLDQPLAHVRKAEGGRGAETLDATAKRTLSEAYGLGPFAGDLESHALVERRRAETEAARQRADELEAEALARADEVKEAHARADRAARDADMTEREGEAARRAALDARRDAEAAEADQRAREVRPPPEGQG